MTIRRFTKIFALLSLVLSSVSFAHAQQFRAAMPSKFTNSSPERLYNAKNCMVRTFTNPETFSCHVHVIKSQSGNILVDPGYYAGDLKDYVKSIGGVEVILLSHCHVEHIIGLNDLMKDYPNAKVYIGTSDLEGLYNRDINYSFERVISEPFIINSEVQPAYPGYYNFAGLDVKVIPTPGHSPGSSLYYFMDEGLLFVGDSIAFGHVPRYDLPNSNVPEIFESLMKIKNLNIPETTEIFFGHGEHIKYSEMLRTYEIFSRPMELFARKTDGTNSAIRDLYFDEGVLFISLEEVIKIAGMEYFGDDNGAVAYIPEFGRLKVRAGSPEAEYDTFSVNMKACAQVKDGKIYLPGKFIAEIFKPFVKWDLKPSPNVITLSYSDHEPLGNMRTKFLNDILFPAIENETGGHVKIIASWGGKVSTSYNALKTVQDSSAQIAVIVPEYFMDALPLHQVFKSFPVGPVGDDQVEFFRSIYENIPALKDEIDAQNLHVIFIATGYPAAFFGHEALNDLREISGQKWRSASFWHKDFLANAGAIPVTMPWGEGVFKALDDGSLDGLIVNIDSGYDIKAHTAAKYITFSPKLWLGHAYLISINKDVWNSLTDDVHAAFERAANSSYEKLGAIMNASLPEQVRALESDGGHVRILSDSEVSDWEEMTRYREIQDRWAREKLDAGFSQAPEVLETTRRLITGQ